MKKNSTILAFVAGIFFGLGQVTSEATVNPYQIIAHRNLFGLQSPATSPAVEVQPAPPTITLTGITSVLGDNRVMFKTASSGVVGWKQHTLAEGQSEDEITLLSVEVRTGTAKFNNHGVLQFISICKPPLNLAGNFPVIVNSPANIARIRNEMKRNGDLPVLQKFVESPDGSPFVRVVARGGSGTSDASDNGTPANNNSANDDSSSPPVANWGSSASTFNLVAGDPWWLAGSKLTEQARIRSAGEVRAGLADPQPRTPLTPANTPSDLIGPDRAYFKHWSAD